MRWTLNAGRAINSLFDQPIGSVRSKTVVLPVVLQKTTPSRDQTRESSIEKGAIWP